MSISNVFFQFADGDRVVSIPKQIKDNFVSSWGHYFKELLKLQPVDINATAPSPPPKRIDVSFW
jgi:hypothetical protein